MRDLYRLVALHSVCIMAMLIHGGVCAAGFYVSPQGDDHADGSAQYPFASLQRAAAAARELRSSQRELAEPVIIELRGGVYPMGSGLVLRIGSANSAPDELIDFITTIAAAVNRLIKAPQDVTSNIGEYCKREACWNRVQVLDVQFSFPSALQPYLLDAVDQERAQQDAAGFQQVANDVAPVLDVFHRGAPYRQHFQEWAYEHPCLAPFESSALRAAASGKPLQDRQAASLLKGLKRAEGMGYYPVQQSPIP